MNTTSLRQFWALCFDFSAQNFYVSEDSGNFFVGNFHELLSVLPFTRASRKASPERLTFRPPVGRPQCVSRTNTCCCTYSMPMIKVLWSGNARNGNAVNVLFLSFLPFALTFALGFFKIEHCSFITSVFDEGNCLSTQICLPASRDKNVAQSQTRITRFA